VQINPNHCCHWQLNKGDRECPPVTWEKWYSSILPDWKVNAVVYDRLSPYIFIKTKEFVIHLTLVYETAI
jgi:hypothetical protein